MIKSMGEENIFWYDVSLNHIFGQLSSDDQVDDDDDDIDESMNDVFTVLCMNCGAFILQFLIYHVTSKYLKSINPISNNNASSGTDHGEDFQQSKVFDLIQQNRNVSWVAVMDTVGLDGYMFLRFLKMCLGICTFSSFYGIAILWPIYYTGSGDTEEWYVLTMQNLSDGSWQLWIGSAHMWLTSLFVLWKIKKELIHYFELRLDFLGLVNDFVDPISNYTLIVEKIPDDLKSERALYNYFDRIFPGKVHSTSLAMNLDDLTDLIDTRKKILHLLEEAYAYHEETNERPFHYAESPLNLFGLGRIWDKIYSTM